MTLRRQSVRPLLRLRDLALSGGAVALGALLCGFAAIEMTLPPGIRTRLSDKGGEWAIPLFIALLAGAVLWTFGAIALAATGWRTSRVVAQITIVCGTVGMLAGGWLLTGYARFEIIRAAGGCAFLAGAVLAGGGVLADVYARRAVPPPQPPNHPGCPWSD